MAIGADRLGGLQQVFDLGEVGVRIGVVDEGVEELHRLPDTHLGSVQPTVVGPLGGGELVGLIDVVESVELPHRGAYLGGVVAEGVPGVRGVAGEQVVLPLVQ